MVASWDNQLAMLEQLESMVYAYEKDFIGVEEFLGLIGW